MYVKYCENKPKSEYIVAEYIDYFEVIRGASRLRYILEDAYDTFSKFISF